MRRLMSLLQLGVGVVLLCTVVVVVPAASQQWCNRVLHDNYGCQTFILASPGGGKCQVATQGSPDFSFYLRPGPTFTSLQIIITSYMRSSTIYIGRNELEQPNKWYHIQMSQTSFVYMSYYVYIDGRERGRKRALFKPHTFDIYVIGSPYYASNCDPGDFPPPPQLLPTVPSPPAKLSVTLPVPDAVNTSQTLTVFPPGHLAVIVGAIAALAATVVVIAVVALEIKRRKRREEYNRTRQSQEPPPIPKAFSGARKSDRQRTYEDVEYLEDIYEEVDNLDLQLRSSSDCC